MFQRIKKKVFVNDEERENMILMESTQKEISLEYNKTENAKSEQYVGTIVSKTFFQTTQLINPATSKAPENKNNKTNLKMSDPLTSKNALKSSWKTSLITCWLLYIYISIGISDGLIDYTL